MEKTSKERNIEGLRRRSTNITPSVDNLRYMYRIPDLIREFPDTLSEENAGKKFNQLVDDSFELEYSIKELRALLRARNNDTENYRFTRTPEAVTGVYDINLYPDEEDSEPPIRKANESGTEGYEVIDITTVSDIRYTERVYAIQIHLYSVLSNRKVADEKLKLDYDWGGGHTSVTSTDAVATGTDCSAFASWAINQGAAENFNTQSTAGLIGVGSQTSFEDAQQGDILVYRNNSQGHVVMIIDNDPETQQFLVAEAASPDTGVVMKTRSYASLAGIYQARDLSSIYND